MEEAYIFDAIRTPRGKRKGGALREVTPSFLLGQQMQKLEKRHQLDTSQIDDVVLGCVTPIGEQGANIPKLADIYAGWNVDVPAMQVNRFCATGLETVNMAAMKVRSGWEDLIVAGGVECMSRVPMGSDGGPMAFDPKTHFHLPFVPQGIGADLIATVEGFGRQDVDNLALMSQKRAAKASENKFFKSLISIEDQNGLLILDHDEHIRKNSTLDELQGLKPSFEKMGQMGMDAVALQNYTHMKRLTISTPLETLPELLMERLWF